MCSRHEASTAWMLQFLCSIQFGQIYTAHLPAYFFVFPSAPPYYTIAHHFLIKLHYMVGWTYWKSLEMTKWDCGVQCALQYTVQACQSMVHRAHGQNMKDFWPKNCTWHTVPVKSPTATDKKTRKRFEIHKWQLQCSRRHISTVEKISDFQL